MSKRTKLVVGNVYSLNSSYASVFRCIKNCPADGYCDFNVLLQNVVSGWTFIAHGINKYEDGSIDWDFSTGGHFEEV